MGSIFAGVAGACTAWFLQFVTVESFTLFASVWYLGMLIVGGTHSPIGAILGVVFITLLQEGLHEVAHRDHAQDRARRAARSSPRPIWRSAAASCWR